MAALYKSSEGKGKILALYDAQLARLPLPFEDIMVHTSFGDTHLVLTGNPNGAPLLVFHGGNATTAYMLLTSGFLFADFKVYGVDLIGHPGKSAEEGLSHKNYDYGKWTGEVIDALGYKAIRCFGGSFGAGVLAKAMCVVPDKIERSVLYIPSAIKNAPAYRLAGMGFPMVMYWITGKERWLVKSLLPMALTEGNISKEVFETAKASIDHAKVKAGMPSDVSPELMRKCLAPTLVIASTKDCLFPAQRVIPQAERMIPNCTTYVIEDRGHLHALTQAEQKIITDFLKQ